MIVIIIGKDTGLVVHVSGSQIVSASLHWDLQGLLHLVLYMGAGCELRSWTYATNTFTTEPPAQTQGMNP